MTHHFSNTDNTHATSVGTSSRVCLALLLLCSDFSAWALSLRLFMTKVT
jgi:hypothetical protein